MPQSWLPIVKVPMFAGENQGPVAPHEAGKNRAEPVYACRSGPVLAWPGAQNAKPLASVKNAQNPSSACIRGSFIECWK